MVPPHPPVNSTAWLDKFFLPLFRACQTTLILLFYYYYEVYIKCSASAVLAARRYFRLLSHLQRNWVRYIYIYYFVWYVECHWNEGSVARARVQRPLLLFEIFMATYCNTSKLTRFCDEMEYLRKIPLVHTTLHFVKYIHSIYSVFVHIARNEARVHRTQDKCVNNRNANAVYRWWKDGKGVFSCSCYNDERLTTFDVLFNNSKRSGRHSKCANGVLCLPANSLTDIRPHFRFFYSIPSLYHVLKGSVLEIVEFRSNNAFVFVIYQFSTKRITREMMNNWH